MSIPLVVAGILALVGGVIHIIGGEVTDIRHLKTSEIPTNLKLEMRMAWYTVAIDIIVSGVYLLSVALGGPLPESEALLGFIALRFVLYGLTAFILMLVTRRDHLLKVPQWALMLGLGSLVWWGMQGL